MQQFSAFLSTVLQQFGFLSSTSLWNMQLYGSSWDQSSAPFLSGREMGQAISGITVQLTWLETEQCHSLHPALLLSLLLLQPRVTPKGPQKQPAGFRLTSSRDHEVKSLLCYWCGSNTFLSVHPSRATPKYFVKSFPEMSWTSPSPLNSHQPGCFRFQTTSLCFG